MSFINVTELTSFAKANSWMTSTPADSGLDLIFKQVDSIIFNKTGVPVPDAPNTDAPILKNIACSLVIYFTTAKQQGLSQDERLFRQKLYDDAMAYLDEVEQGSKKVYKNDGTVISVSRSAAPSAMFSSDQRITGMI